MEKSEKINELEKLLKNFKDIKFERRKEIDGSLGKDYYISFSNRRCLIVWDDKKKKVSEIIGSNRRLKGTIGLNNFRIYKKVIERIRSAGYNIERGVYYY